MGKIALLLSHLLNPALLALLVFAVEGWFDDWFIGFVAMGIFALLPGGVLLILVRWRYLDQVYPDDRDERAILLMLGGLCYAVGWAILYWLGAGLMVLLTAGTFVFCTLLVWLINRYWKISIHAAGVGATACILLVTAGEVAVPFLLALPAIAWARLYLRAHTPAQVGVGMVLGIAIPALLFHVFELL